MILNNSHPPVLSFDLFSLTGLSARLLWKPSRSIFIRKIIKIKHKHGYRAYLATMFITKFLGDVSRIEVKNKTSDKLVIQFLHHQGEVLLSGGNHFKSGEQR